MIFLLKADGYYTVYTAVFQIKIAEERIIRKVIALFYNVQDHSSGKYRYEFTITYSCDCYIHLIL